MGFAALHPTRGLNRKTLAPRSTLQRHQSASNQPELILKLLSAVDPGLGDTANFYSIGLGEAAMKQTIMWLALALLFAIGVTLSITADSFGPAATAETTGPATLVEAPQPCRRGERETGRAGGSRCDAR